MTDRLRIVFAGTPDFAVPALDALHAAGYAIRAVYTQPDRPAGRGQSLNSSAVKRRAIELGLPLEQPATLRTTEAAADLAALQPDLMVVVAYGLILPPAILGVPRLGCWNIHASLLPRWRGAAPIQRAILAGDTTTGITIMQMDAGLDTGPMLLVRPTLIGARETGGQLHDRLAALGAEAIVAAIGQCLAGRLVAARQPDEVATYAAKIRKEEAVIDWRQPSTQIDRQVRAFNPWPVAETAQQSFAAYVPAPMIGESPTRPHFLPVMPPVEVAAARLPVASSATAPTVPIRDSRPASICPCSSRSSSSRRRSVAK